MRNNAKERLGILESMMRSRCSRQTITELAPDEVFVFGTDPDGNHKSSAAQLAVAEFGAKVGRGEGFYGHSYAIPVHKFKTGLMIEAVNRFLDFAMGNQQLRFHVLPVGCGAAGMDPAFVSLMFRKAIDLPNVWLSKQFINELIRYYTIGVEISEDCTTVIRCPMDYKGLYNIPLGVKCIGKSAFMGCCGCELKISDSIKRIEEWAFCDMGVVGRSLLIPRSVEFIDDKAFESEWFSPSMAVFHNSYAYHWARMHNQQYECIDFDEIADVNTAKEGKQSAKIYLDLAKKLASEPRNTLVLEDMPTCVKTAFKSGFLTVAVYDDASKAYDQEKKDNSHLFIKDFSELIKELKQ